MILWCVVLNYVKTVLQLLFPSVEDGIYAFAESLLEPPGFAQLSLFFGFTILLLRILSSAYAAWRGRERERDVRGKGRSPMSKYLGDIPPCLCRIPEAERQKSQDNATSTLPGGTGNAAS